MKTKPSERERYHTMLKKFVFISFSLLFAVYLSACAGSSRKNTVSPEAAEKNLRTRITQFHEAKIAGDWARTYTFLDAAYKRENSLAQFATAPRKTRIKAFSIDTISFDTDYQQAEVMVKLDMEIKGFVFPNTPQKQFWILENNQWVNLVSSADSPPTPMQKN